jgi:hypothetical protein
MLRTTERRAQSRCVPYDSGLSQNGKDGLAAVSEYLKLDRLIIVYPGDRRYPLADQIEVVPLAELVAGDLDAESLFRRHHRQNRGKGRRT